MKLNLKVDGFVKGRKIITVVIAAQAAIQSFRNDIDSGLRRSDGFGSFCDSVKVAFFLSLCLLVIHAGAGAAKSHALSYPDPLLKKLGIDSSDIIKNQKKFNNNPVHTQWVNHINEAIPDIDADKKDAIIKTHTSLLFIKDKLDKAFFSGKINKQEFTTRLTGVMKWFQEANQSILNDEEYNILFGITGQDDNTLLAPSSDGGLGFPIKNPKTTIEMIKKKFDAATIRNIALFYQDQARELRDIKEIYETKDFRRVKPEQVKNDIIRAENELQAAFKNYCHEKLSNEQFKLLFGNKP